MNHNFLGAPAREDTQTLDQLRRQLMPMVGLLDKMQHDMNVKLHQGQAVDWPHIRHSISLINSYLTSINGYINGSYRHTDEAVKDAQGKPALDKQGNPQVIYRDYVNEGHAQRIGALHVFPQAPFPMGDERLAAMAATLLNKRLGPVEEKWVEERVRKASEFAHVPSEWGIEPRKPKADEQDEEDDDDDDDMKGWDDGIPTKRVKGTLNEDEVLFMWANGHKTAFNREYWVQMRFGEEVADEGESPANASDQEMEDEEEYEDEDAETPKAPAAPVVMIQRAPPAVHKPVVGTPAMALGFVHRFMTSGDAIKR
ncbi:hypothetical protein CC86DRAFT_372321 [Ophiobolus disseminans]|uniref:Mediator complex subunit 8 n=1 Tax=Ophiobolus disseminans TaxID=1469910 RepID=A0A6A6ZRA6_9PLEO|nr:hypothetical protein CC86DRAFT_372321 [Ophiobolus disseminans]